MNSHRFPPGEAAGRQNIATRVAELLRHAGHDAVHVSELGMQRAKDDEILGVALAQDRVIVSEDTDFGALLARSGARAPSFVLIRSAAPMTPDVLAFLLAAALPQLVEDLDAGCIAVVTRARVRVRPLPIARDDDT